MQAKLLELGAQLAGGVDRSRDVFADGLDAEHRVYIPAVERVILKGSSSGVEGPVTKSAARRMWA